MNQRSAIGRISANVANALLARGHRVHILATELSFGDHLPSHPTNATVSHWSEMTEREIRQDYDVVFLNIGDHFQFHGGIFWLLEATAPVGIFHDFYLYDLFNGWLWETGKAKSESWFAQTHDNLVAQAYGQEMLPLAVQVRQGALQPRQIAQKLPMTEWIARRCSGALAHAHFYHHRLADACGGPTRVALLPGMSRGVALASERPQQGDKTVNVLTVGVMNPNKCVDRVIEAIGKSPALKNGVEYHLVGPIEPPERERLLGFAASLGFPGLRIFGEVDDAALLAHLTRSDIICCLRDPILEGASASAVEALFAGRPLVVANAGFYAELPDGVVFKVSADVNVIQLGKLLTRLAADEALRLQAGLAARQWAQVHLSLTGYAQEVEFLADSWIAASPMLKLARSIGSDLAAIGLYPDDPAVPRLATAVKDLLGQV